MANGTDTQKFQTLRRAGAGRPGVARSSCSNRTPPASPRTAVDYLRGMVAAALASQSPDEAVTVAESIQEPGDEVLVLDRPGRQAARLGRALAKPSCWPRRSCRRAASSSRANGCGCSAASPSGGSTWAKESGRSALFDEGRALAKEVPAAGLRGPDVRPGPGSRRPCRCACPRRERERAGQARRPGQPRFRLRSSLWRDRLPRCRERPRRCRARAGHDRRRPPARRIRRRGLLADGRSKICRVPGGSRKRSTTR